jgi:hypothetical protein
MFRFIPREQGEWLRVLLFPFQAYVVVAFLVEQYFIRSLPSGGGYRGSLAEFKVWVIAGYAICFLVLLGVGIVQIFTNHRLRGFLNVGLAALGALLGLSMMNFVYA